MIFNWYDDGLFMSRCLQIGRFNYVWFVDQYYQSGYRLIEMGADPDMVTIAGFGNGATMAM